jgi:hypothetical protein
MTVTLMDAIEAIEARKQSVFSGVDGPGLVLADESGERLMLSGFPIEHTEFKNLADRAGVGFATMAMTLNVPTACAGAWSEGLLIGLMFAQLVRAAELREVSHGEG